MEESEAAIRAAQERLGANVLRRRQARNISQITLSQRTGITRSYISEIEGGALNLKLDTIVRIAIALGTTPAKLLE